MLRMLPVRLFALTVMAAAAIVLVPPSAANADGALVINKPDSLGCFFGGTGRSCCGRERMNWRS